jgi:DNA mismatch endonuclease (patch repair protein)
MDILIANERSRQMALVKSADTRPELVVRKLLHRFGFRFRVHVRTLPGTPDLVFPGLHKVVFIDGCFWHGHTCRRGQIRPQTNRAFWNAKLDRNLARDQENIEALRQLGWGAFRVWECEISSGNWIQPLMLFLAEPNALP